MGTSKKIWLIIKVVQARLRFFVLLAAVGALLFYWDRLLAQVEKWWRPELEAVQAAPDVEYWCSMDPYVVQDKPGKCPVCHMDLRPRKKGKPEPLPPGVIHRVQLSPYRVVQAGIQTWPISYKQLYKEITAAGFVEFDERKLFRITCRLPGKTRIDKLYVNFTGEYVRKGDPLALLFNPDLTVTVQNLIDARKEKDKAREDSARDRLRLWGLEDGQIEKISRTGKPVTQVTLRAPMENPKGHPFYHVIRKYQVEGDYVEEGARLYDLADLSTVWIEAQIYEDELAFLEPGLAVSAATKAYPNRVFHGQLAFLHPHLDAASRTLRVRFDMPNDSHDLKPGMYATVTLKVPAGNLKAFEQKFGRELSEALLAGPWMSPTPAASLAGPAALFALRQDNLLLAVPQSAVIDTGARKIVYRESDPGIFDAIEVKLGPRSGGFYPVVDGLKMGDRVATAGSFLIDAESRLTSGAGSIYFGASGGPHAGHHAAVQSSPNNEVEKEIKANLDRLGPADREAARLQKYCAVLQGSRLGSMGPPLKITLQGETGFLCCKNCEREAHHHPEKTLARARELRNQGKTNNKVAQ